MPDNQPSIGQLVSKTVSDAKRLATAQLALAKAEMQASKQAITAATALGVTALILLPLAILFLLFTLAYGLQQMGLQTWAAFGIVSVPSTSPLLETSGPPESPGITLPRNEIT